MEFTGLNLLLILFAPVAVVFILMLLLYPLINKVFHRHKPIEKQMKVKKEEFKEQSKVIRNQVIHAASEQFPSQQKIYGLMGQMHTLRKIYFRFVSDALKQFREIRKEESGFKDIENEMKRTISNYTLWHVGSMLFTPMAFLLLIISGLNTIYLKFFGISEHSELPIIEYLLFLIFPAIGFLLAYKGYKDYKNRLALILCLLINTLYTGGIIYGVFRLGISP